MLKLQKLREKLYCYVSFFVNFPSQGASKSLILFFLEEWVNLSLFTQNVFIISFLFSFFLHSNFPGYGTSPVNLGLPFHICLKPFLSSSQAGILSMRETAFIHQLYFPQAASMATEFPADTVSINPSLHSIQSHLVLFYPLNFYQASYLEGTAASVLDFTSATSVITILPATRLYFETSFSCESSGNWNRNNERGHCPACQCSTTTSFQM